jgi:hypothetical protein
LKCASASPFQSRDDSTAFENRLKLDFQTF